MTLNDLLEAVEIQGAAAIAVYDYDREEYTDRVESYAINRHPARRKYGAYIVRYIYPDNDQIVIEISTE